MPPMRGSGSLYDLLSATALPPENCKPAVTEIAPSGHQANFRVLNLTRATFMAQLTSGLDDMIGAPHMGFRKQAAVRIERQVPPEFDTSSSHEILHLAAFAKPHRLNLQHHHVSETVIDFHEINIL